MFDRVAGIILLVLGCYAGAAAAWAWRDSSGEQDAFRRIMTTARNWGYAIMASIAISAGLFNVLRLDQWPLAVKVVAVGGGTVLALCGAAAVVLNPWAIRYTFARFYRGSWFRTLKMATIAVAEAFAVELVSIGAILLASAWRTPFSAAISTLCFVISTIFVAVALAALLLIAALVA